MLSAIRLTCSLGSWHNPQDTRKWQLDERHGRGKVEIEVSNVSKSISGLIILSSRLSSINRSYSLGLGCCGEHFKLSSWFFPNHVVGRRLEHFEFSG